VNTTTSGNSSTNYGQKVGVEQAGQHYHQCYNWHKAAAEGITSN